MGIEKFIKKDSTIFQATNNQYCTKEDIDVTEKRES